MNIFKLIGISALLVSFSLSSIIAVAYTSHKRRFAENCEQQGGKAYQIVNLNGYTSFRFDNTPDRLEEIDLACLKGKSLTQVLLRTINKSSKKYDAARTTSAKNIPKLVLENALAEIRNKTAKIYKAQTFASKGINGMISSVADIRKSSTPNSFQNDSIVWEQKTIPSIGSGSSTSKKTRNINADSLI